MGSQQPFPICPVHGLPNTPLFRTGSATFYTCPLCEEEQATKKELGKMDEKETYNGTAKQLLEKHGSPFEQDLFHNYVQYVLFEQMGRKMMVCHLTCCNGFEEIGTAGCEDPTKFDAVTGFTYSLKDALRKLGEKVVFARAEKANTPAVQFHVTPECVDALNTHIQHAVFKAVMQAKGLA